MPDGRSPIPTCPECGKSFPSNKSLYGHLRCHPERDYRGVNRPLAFQIDDYVDPEVVAGMLLLSSPRSDLAGPDELESEQHAASSSQPSHQGIKKLRPEQNSAGASAAGERTYPCSLCFRVFSSHQALGGHTASHNKDKTTSNGEEADKEAATRKSAITEHKCRFCDVSFTSGQALGGHQRRHFKELSIQQAHDPAASPSTRSCEADEMGSNRASASCSESEEAVRKKHRVVMMDLDLNLEPSLE
ncbi:zinc finger protein ZAT2-like [Zingiber officinale]|uniref:zinc finger protein ZAT2-like n=1 Tax=Zingiber officinale TaxID=94328 RepID=UPI001C4B3B6D|nr:zinc finger protein ZAT2-like [Zingiber officinale]